MKRPVVPIKRTLYGHPDPGGFREQHCEQCVKKCGFEPIPNWPSTFFNAKEKAFLMI